MKTGRLEAIAKGLSLRAPLKTPDLPRPRSTLMNALSRFFVGVSTLFCLVVLCPSTGFAVSANASPTATFGFTTSTQDVTISDRSYCEEGETECECPNGYVVSGTVKRKKYQVSGSARPECSYSGEDSSTSTIDTRLTPDVSSLSSCERDNVTSMSCGPITLSDDYIGQCITLSYFAECTAIGQCYNGVTDSYDTCRDSDSASGSKTISIPPSIDGVMINRGAPCGENDTDCPSEDCITDADCFNDFMNDSYHVGYQNSLRKNKTMSVQFYVYAALRVGDYVDATLSGAGVSVDPISGNIEEPLEDNRLILEFNEVTPTRTGDVKLNLTVSRSGCSATASYSIPVKSDYCKYPVDESDADNVCNLKYYFYDPNVECEKVDVPGLDVPDVDAGGIEDIDSNYNEADLDYDAGIVEDFDAAIDWDAGVGEEEDDVDDGDGADSGATDAGSSDNQNPDEPNLDAGTTDADGGAFSSGNGDPNNGGENSGQGGNGGSGSGSDAGSGSGGSSDSDAGFTGGIGLPSVDEFVDGGTGEGAGDGSGSGSDSGDEGPDSEFTGGDTGFSGGASGDLGDSSADGNGNGNGSGSGNGSGTGTGGSGNGSGSGGQGSGEAPEGGTGFTGGTGFPGGAGFDGYDWGSGDSQGETTPSAPGSGDGSGSGSGNGSGTGDGSGNGSGNGSGTGDGSGSGSGNGSGTGDGSGNGSGNGSGTGDGSGNGSGNGSGTGDGSGNGSGNGSGTGDGSGSGSGNGSGTGDGSGNGSGNGSGTGDGSGNGSGNGSGTGDGSGSGSGNGSGTGDGSGNGSGNGSGTGDGSGSGSGNGSGTGDGSGNGSGNQQFSLTGGVQKESTVTGCGGCSGSGASFLLGWLGLALLPALRRRKRG